MTSYRVLSGGPGRMTTSADSLTRNGSVSGARMRTPHREPCGQVYPVQVALHIGKARRKRANLTGVRLHTKANAIHHTVVAHIGTRQYIYVGVHSGLDMLELGFAKVCYRPPDTRVDKREDLLAFVCISTL